jgi:hypothetical protein
MRVELAKEIVDFNKGLDSKVRMREIISEIHNVCISDIHFQNDQLSNISNDLNNSIAVIKSKKTVLNEAIKATEKIENNNKKLILNIDEQRERLLSELTGD